MGEGDKGSHTPDDESHVDDSWMMIRKMMMMMATMMMMTMMMTVMNDLDKKAMTMTIVLTNVISYNDKHDGDNRQTLIADGDSWCLKLPVPTMIS